MASGSARTRRSTTTARESNKNAKVDNATASPEPQSPFRSNCSGFNLTKMGSAMTPSTPALPTMLVRFTFPSRRWSRHLRLSKRVPLLLALASTSGSKGFGFGSSFGENVKVDDATAPPAIQPLFRRSRSEPTFGQSVSGLIS